MSLKAQPIGPIPEDIAQVVRQALRPTDPLVVIGDRLSTFVSDESFADLYPAEGKPALSPALLAMVTLLQYWAFLSDRQAVHMVVARLDWKYALHLPLAYAGFDHSVLCEFRQRLIAHAAQTRVFDQLLNALRQAGLLTGQHVQRTDSLAVLGTVRELSRLELDPAPGADGTGSAGPGLAEGGGAQPLGRGVWGLDPARTAGAPQG